MKFNGKILVLGLGSVSRCTLPLIFKDLGVDPKQVTVMDFNPIHERVQFVKENGAEFVKDRIHKETMGDQLKKYVDKGDIIVDLAWNIGCIDILEWCHKNEVGYINTSVEFWNPYQDLINTHPTERTLYARHMLIREQVKNWKKQGATAVLEHGANPGLVSHFTKAALMDIGNKWMSDNPVGGEKHEQIQEAMHKKMFNNLAQALDIKVIHVSERDTQIASVPKEVNEFVNTWSVEGFYEEGIAPAEMGWGTHERILPPEAQVHASGPLNQICLSNMGCQTWVRSWVPTGEIVGMVIRHGEAFTISDHLTVWENGKPVYRPTVHYAYCPCDSAIVSLHELHMRRFKLQRKQRILNDEIISGRDELGCLLMGHAYKSWWIGSLLDIHETRHLVPGQNATTLQVAASVLAALKWIIRNPRAGINVPDDLPYDEILKDAKPYLGPFVSQPVNWDPLKNWYSPFEKYGRPKPETRDMWQFSSFFIEGLEY